MLKQPRRKTTAPIIFTATAALGLLFATPQALAQNNSGSSNTGFAPAGTEKVIVTAPQYDREPGPTGSDIVGVSESAQVPVGDLDLNTAWGREELRTRVRDSAAEVCGQLESIYPAGQSGKPCYANAVSNSIHRANYAVRDAYYTKDDDFFFF